MHEPIKVIYEKPGQSINEAWAKAPEEPLPGEKAELKARIRRLLKEREAVLVAHYYVHPDILSGGKK